MRVAHSLGNPTRPFFLKKIRELLFISFLNFSLKSNEIHSVVVDDSVVVDNLVVDHC